MFTILSFKIIGNKQDVYTGRNCMETFSESLREHAVKLTNFDKKKKMKLLTNEQQETYENTKICYICK